MSREYFYESQYLRSSMWIWVIIIPAAAIPLGVIMHHLFVQIGTGIPQGNEPMSDRGLILLTLFIILTDGLLIWMIYSLRLEIRVDNSGLSYKFFPHSFGWKTISASSIISHEVSKRSFLKTGGWSYRRGFPGMANRLVLRGDSILTIVTADQKKTMLSTTDPEGLDRALKKLKSEPAA